MATYRFIQLDVFTETPLCGNPLAVFPEAEGLSDQQMLKIAREMNLSETVFVLEPEALQDQDGNGKTGENKPHEVNVLRRLRIFTPARELPFAGHPIVGTWTALAQEGVVAPPRDGNGWTRIQHEVGIGVLPVDIEFKDGQPVQVVMTQGKFQIRDEVDDRHKQAEIARALGRNREDLDESLPIQIISTGLPALAVPFRSLADLGHCRVDAALLAEVYTRLGATACYAFTRETIEGGDARAHARLFAPADNISEDPATGSAGGALGAYLIHHHAIAVEPKDRKFRFIIEQGDFMDRPSRINVEIKGEFGAIEEVRVGGAAVVIMRGELTI